MCVWLSCVCERETERMESFKVDLPANTPSAHQARVEAARQQTETHVLVAQQQLLLLLLSRLVHQLRLQLLQFLLFGSARFGVQALL